MSSLPNDLTVNEQYDKSNAKYRLQCAIREKWLKMPSSYMIMLEPTQQILVIMYSEW